MQNQHSSDSNLPQPVADVRVGRPTPSFGTAPDSRGGGTWHGAGQVRAAERTLRDYLDIMIRRRWLLLCVLAGSIVITAVYTYTATKYYSSTAVIEIEAKKQREQAKVSSASDYDEFQRYFLTQQEILRSRHLVETLVNEMNLTQSPEFSTRKVSWFDALLEGHGSKEVPVEEKGDTVDATTTLGVVNTLVRRISVKPVRTSNLISVTVDATTPEMAQQLLQNLLRLYLRNNLEIRRQESIDAARWLKEELDKSEKKLRDSRAALVGFTVDHGIVDSADGGLQQVLQMVSKTMEGHVKSSEERARVQALQQRHSPEMSSSLPSEMKNEFLDKLREELASVESEYSQMQGVYSTNYPKMRMMEKRLKFLRERISQVEEKVVESALDTAKTKEQLLKQYYDGARAEADRVKSLEAQYSLLKSAVDSTDEFHKILLREYKEMDIRARTTSNNLRTVDPPGRPSRPSKPQKMMLLLIGAVVGIVGGVAAALAAETLDDTVRTPHDVEQKFQVRNLGAVPDAEKVNKTSGLPALNCTMDFVAFAHPKSAMSDAIRNVQASIFISDLSGSVSSVAVSSSNPGEGKSLVSISLASVLASVSKKRVVIIDADMRKPRVHKAFGLTSVGKGLADVLDGLDLDPSSVILRTNVPGLSLISAGGDAYDPVTLLQSKKMTLLMERLRSRFDFIVIDTPPILGFADTPLVCRHVDGLVMVVKQAYSKSEEIALALQTVQTVGSARVLGVVLNHVKPSAGGYGYGYNYGYGYYKSYKYYRKGA